MRWFWQRRPPPPHIPPYQPPIVQERAKPKEEGIKVEEVDTSAMTRTGVHKAWRRLTGKEP